MQKFCPRCHSILECLGSDILKCPCASLQLSSDTKQYLSKTRYDCLCNSCLIELDNLVEESKKSTFPISKVDIVESVHYYYEGPYLVMTELYHIIRGHCCQSGCRHCAFGFKS
jgi:hypothetical protein